MWLDGSCAHLADHEADYRVGNRVRRRFLTALRRPTLSAWIRPPGRLAAAPAAIVSLLTLIGYTAGYDLGVDHFMVGNTVIAAGHIPAGRMVPDTALALLLASLS
jgi:hypothetical protein